MNIENSVDEIAVSFDNRASQISLKPVVGDKRCGSGFIGNNAGLCIQNILKKVKKTLKNIAKIVDKRI